MHDNGTVAMATLNRMTTSFAILLLLVVFIAMAVSPLPAQQPTLRRTMVEKELHPILFVAFSPDGKTFVTDGVDPHHPATGGLGQATSKDAYGTIKLWEVASGQNTAILYGHTGWVMSVAFSPDAKLLASGSSDKTIKLWDLTTRKIRGTLLMGDTHIPFSIAFSPDGKQIASGGMDRMPNGQLVLGSIKLWDVASRKNVATLFGHGGELTQVAYSPNGKLLASGSGDETIKVWDLAGRKNTITLPQLRRNQTTNGQRRFHPR